MGLNPLDDTREREGSELIIDPECFLAKNNIKVLMYLFKKESQVNILNRGNIALPSE